MSMNGEAKRKPRALVVVQCFPPLLKNSGGVSKRYLTLCRALIDDLGWQVTLLTPVSITSSKEADVHRWLGSGQLQHLPARGCRITSSNDGVAVFLDLMSAVNAGKILNELCIRRDYDCMFVDDIPFRIELLLLARGMGVPAVVSTHTDITHMASFKGPVAMAWYIHMLSTYFAAVHATVSHVFGSQIAKAYRIPVGGIWPPILWSPVFKSDPSQWKGKAAEQRSLWLQKLSDQGCKPKVIMLSVGRWSAEKRIHLLVDALPEDCALVIVGDGTSEYANKLAALKGNVLPLRKMVDANDLRVAYTACDLLLSASNFETLGNTVIEALCSGTPVAVQPAQGHLEFVKDQINSWFVDFDNTKEAKATLQRIVASGLDEKSLEGVLPELKSTGDKLRNADFGKDFDKALVQPALEIGRSYWGSNVASNVLEVFKRSCCLIPCIFLWFLLRVFTRISFVCLSDPEVEVLGPLGSASDDKRAPSVLAFPCLRPFQSYFAKAPSPDKASPVRADSDGTDYASHFEAARKSWWQKRL